MSKKVNTKFVPVYIYKPDKLQYMADDLSRVKIQFIAESNTIYIPNYALKTAQEISRHYKSDENAFTIREQIVGLGSLSRFFRLRNLFTDISK